MTAQPRWTARSRPCIVIASDADCVDIALLEDVQAFVRSFGRDRRVLLDYILDRAIKGGAVLVDRNGNRAWLADLSEEEYERFGEWIRGWIIKRPPDLQRRVARRSLERVRFVLTALQMGWPKESRTWGRSYEEVGVLPSEFEATETLFFEGDRRVGGAGL